MLLSLRFQDKPRRRSVHIQIVAGERLVDGSLFTATSVLSCSVVQNVSHLETMIVDKPADSLKRNTTRDVKERLQLELFKSRLDFY